MSSRKRTQKKLKKKPARLVAILGVIVVIILGYWLKEAFFSPADAANQIQQGSFSPYFDEKFLEAIKQQAALREDSESLSESSSSAQFSTKTLEASLPEGWTMLERIGASNSYVTIAADQEGKKHFIYSKSACGFGPSGLGLIFGLGRSVPCDWNSYIQSVPEAQQEESAATILKPFQPPGDNGNIGLPLPNLLPKELLTKPEETLEEWFVRVRPAYCLFPMFNRLEMCLVPKSKGHLKVAAIEKLKSRIDAAKFGARSVGEREALDKWYEEMKEKWGGVLPNKDGERTRLAARAFAWEMGTSPANYSSASSRAFANDANKVKADKILFRHSRTNKWTFIPYQDPDFATIYYYRCGPFDLVGTIEDIKKDCHNFQYVNHDPNAQLKLKGYVVDEDKLIKIDMQTDHDERDDFENGLIPPNIFKFGDYVYGTHFFERPDIVPLTAEGRLIGKVQADGTWTGQEDASLEYPTMDKAYHWPKNSPYGSEGGEWIRYKGMPTRMVFDQPVDKSLADGDGKIFYARIGDVIRFHVPLSDDKDVQIVGQPIEGNSIKADSFTQGYKLEELNDRKVSKIDSSQNFLPIAGGRIITRAENISPILFVNGVKIDTHWRTYEYEVFFPEGNAQRLRTRIVREGNSALVHVGPAADNSLPPSQISHYSYIVPELYNPWMLTFCHKASPDQQAGSGSITEDSPLNPKYNCTPRKTELLWPSHRGPEILHYPGDPGYSFLENLRSLFFRR